MSGRLGVLAALALAVCVLVASGSVLEAPPWPGFGAWLDRVGAVVAAVALVRIVALAMALLLLVVTVARLVAEAAGAWRVVATLDRALPSAVRRVLGGVAGVGAVGSALVAAGAAPLPGAAAGGAPVPAVATMSQVGVATVQVDGADGSGQPEATMRVVEDDPLPAPPDGPAVVDPAGEPEVWVVAPGDSFWSIAEDVVGERLGRPGSDREVAAYWGPLVEANRTRLVTGDPDLIFPGQRLVLVG